MTMKPRFAAMALAILVVLASPSAHAADVVVVASNVPAYKAGQVIDSAAMLDLAPGQKLTCIAANGKSVTRAGPYKGPVWDTTPPSGDKKFIEGLASLASGQGKGGQTLGAVRGAKTGEPGDAWAVDVGRAGDHCVAAGKAPVLWRAAAEKAAVLNLAGAKEEGRAQAEWPAGAPTIDWPAEVKLQDGAVYMARLDASATAKRLVIRVVPDGLISDAHRAVWMAQAGCTHQGRLLLWGASGAQD